MPLAHALLTLLAAASPERLWMDGTFLDPMVMNITERHDPSFAPSGLLALSASGPEVGDTVMFWAQDFSGGGDRFTFYLVKATCRYVGEHSYIFVEDDAWGRHFLQQDVDDLAASLEDATPADPTMGIIEKNSSVLGAIPDEIDGDPRVYFLVLDIRDGFVSQGAFVAGLFSPYNQFTEEEAFTRYGGHSNEVEMLYIDCYPGDAAEALYTASHELVHLIQWGIRPFSGEDLWVIENQAQTGTFLCGYPASQVSTFIEAGGVTPVGWTEFTDDLRYVAGYGAGYLFFSYLYERFGGDAFIHGSLRASNRGLPGVEEVVEKAIGSQVDMMDILTDWALACWIDDPSIGDGRWGWDSFRIADYEYDPDSPRDGLDWQGVVSTLPFEDPVHDLPAMTLDAYSMECPAAEGSFRASASGMGGFSAWFRESPGDAPRRLETGQARDIAVPLPAEGEVLLLCNSFFGLNLQASAGDLGLAAGGLAVFPQPCFGTLYLGLRSDGSQATLSVFDATGRHVETIDFGAVDPGETVLSYPGASLLSTGVYAYRFVQGGAEVCGRFAVVR